MRKRDFCKKSFSGAQVLKAEAFADENYFIFLLVCKSPSWLQREASLRLIGIYFKALFRGVEKQHQASHKPGSVSR